MTEWMDSVRGDFCIKCGRREMVVSMVVLGVGRLCPEHWAEHQERERRADEASAARAATERKRKGL
jgi:hypothetical protein